MPAVTTRSQTRANVELEHIHDTYKYFHQVEHRAVVDPMHKQKFINAHMRSILVDWLIDVHRSARLEQETLYITINIIDRYLAQKRVDCNNLQLIGCSALLIASKYEETKPVDVIYLIYMTEEAYSHDQIVGMETRVLQTLNYQISVPHAYTFLVHYLKAAYADKTLYLTAQYVLEESLLSYHMIKTYTPSQLAAAAVLIGRKSVGRPPWSHTLKRFSEYCEEDVVPVATDMIANYFKTNSLSIKKKYLNIRFGRFALRKLEAAINTGCLNNL